MILMRVPRSVGELAEAIPKHRDKLATRFDQATGSETSLAKQIHAVAFSQLSRLATDI